MKNFVVFFSIFITFKIIIYEAHSNMNMSKNRWFMNYSKPRPVIFLWLLYDPFMQTLEKKKLDHALDMVTSRFTKVVKNGRSKFYLFHTRNATVS